MKLNNHQCARVGRLSFALDEIEYYVELYLTVVVRTPECSVAIEIAKEGGFSAKLERFKKVLEAIRREHPFLDGDIDAVLGVLGNAKEISEGRNEYIHALAEEDAQTKQPYLRTRVKGRITHRPFPEAEIDDLTARAERVVRELHERGGWLYNRLNALPASSSIGCHPG
jgi:hypothetical protein